MHSIFGLVLFLLFQLICIFSCTQYITVYDSQVTNLSKALNAHADVFVRNHEFITYSVVIAFDSNDWLIKDNSSSVNHSTKFILIFFQLWFQKPFSWAVIEEYLNSKSSSLNGFVHSWCAVFMVRRTNSTRLWRNKRRKEKKKREQELQANLKVMQLGMFPRQPVMRNKRRAVNFTISFLVIGHQNCFLSHCELGQ